jgi:hypothetical protein
VHQNETDQKYDTLNIKVLDYISIIYMQSANTTYINVLLLQTYLTTTCFGPVGGPSSGCAVGLLSNYILGVWGGSHTHLMYGHLKVLLHNLKMAHPRGRNM